MYQTEVLTYLMYQTEVCVLSCISRVMLQGGEDSSDALSCKSFFVKEPLIIGLFCGEWPMKIRDPTTLRHPVNADHNISAVLMFDTHETEVRVCVCVWIHMNQSEVRVYVCVCVQMNWSKVRVYVCACVRMNQSEVRVYVCVCVYMRACMFVRMCVRLSVCVYA